jgi:hypothetical protein
MRDEVVGLEDLGVVTEGTREAGGADRGEGRSRRVPMDSSGAQSALACLLRADAACAVETVSGSLDSLRRGRDGDWRGQRTKGRHMIFSFVIIAQIRESANDWTTKISRRSANVVPTGPCQLVRKKQGEMNPVRTSSLP